MACRSSTVNGSDQPAANLADTVLTFTTIYPGQRAERVVTVQSATEPQGPWTDLDTGLPDRGGTCRYDESSDQYVLGTTNYPQQSAVYFRSRVVTDGFADESRSRMLLDRLTFRVQEPGRQDRFPVEEQRKSGGL